MMRRGASKQVKDEDDNRFKLSNDAKNRMFSSRADEGDIGQLWSSQDKEEKERIKKQKEYTTTKNELRHKRHQVWSKYFKSVNKKHTVAFGVFIAMAGLIFFLSDTNSPPKTDTLGDIYISAAGEESSAIDGSAPVLPKEEPTEFQLLYRAGIDQQLYEIAKVSPNGAAPAYTYIDRLTEGGVVFRVTQQEIPGNFSLAQIAEDFQATNVIQVDDEKIYHGYSEKGRTQSLLFIKNKLLVSIRSPEKLTDDEWASYFLSLE